MEKGNKKNFEDYLQEGISGFGKTIKRIMIIIVIAVVLGFIAAIVF